MSENKEHPPSRPQLVPLTPDQFNVVFSQMLAGLRTRDVSSPSVETSSEEEEEKTHETTESSLPSSPPVTREESDASSRALLHLLEAHKILCDAVYHQLLKR